MGLVTKMFFSNSTHVDKGDKYSPSEFEVLQKDMVCWKLFKKARLNTTDHQSLFLFYLTDFAETLGWGFPQLAATSI